MKSVAISDAECRLMIEEEQRLCEQNIQLLKGTLKAGISFKDGNLVKEDIVCPCIRLGRKLTRKERELYTDTDTTSTWKMIKENEKLYIFLEVVFSKTNGSPLNFCLEMSTTLKKSGKEKIMKFGGIELIRIPMEFGGETGYILQWMKLLVSAGGNISISDGIEPSIGVDGIMIDIPKLILVILKR